MQSKGVHQKTPLSVCDFKFMQVHLEWLSVFDDIPFQVQLNTSFSGLLHLGELVKNDTHLNGYQTHTCFHYLATRATWSLRGITSFAGGSQVLLTLYPSCANTLMHVICSTLSISSSGCDMMDVLLFIPGGSPNSYISSPTVIWQGPFLISSWVLVSGLPQHGLAMCRRIPNTFMC